MKKGLIAIQYWAGDIKKAMGVARLIADMEPTRRDDIDFAFIARADCKHELGGIDYVSRKFNVRKLTCRMRAVGHPWGCWVLWFSLLEWVYKTKLEGTSPDYKWIFTFEADCVPSSKTWLNDIDEEFIRLNTMLVGAEWLHGLHHLNGNILVSGDKNFLTWLIKGVTLAGVPPHEPWDVFLFPQFTQWGVGFSKRIINCYARRTMSRVEFDDLRHQGFSVIHGVKDDSALHWARSSFVS